MQYISPFSLMETHSGALPEGRDVLLAQNKLLAQLELNGGDIVTIQGRELTKNEITNFFGSLLQADNMTYHAAVAKDAVLLRFLEYSILQDGDVFDLFEAEELYNDARFIDWISPYFFTSFKNFAEECLREKNDSGWEALLTNPRLMNAQDEEEAWMGIEKIVRNDLERLYTFDVTKGEKGLAYIEAAITNQYIEMLEQLPEERFHQLRDEYACAMAQCAVHIFNNISSEEACTVITNAQQLAVSAGVRESIAEQEAIMYPVNYKVPSHGNRSSRSAWSALFVLLVALRAATCNTGSGNDYQYNKVHVVNSNPTRTDSLLAPMIIQLNRADSIHAAEQIQTLPIPRERKTYVDSILRAFKLNDSTR